MVALVRAWSRLTRWTIAKHMVNTEIWYFGDVFGQEWPTPEERVTDEDEADPQAD